jgi:thioredoxin-related protein
MLESGFGASVGTLTVGYGSGSGKMLSMKKIVFALAFLAVSLSAVQVHWLHDYREALVLAKKEHKDVYLFIGADKCRFCKKFKERTLVDEKVKRTLAEHFVPLYLSRDRHAIPDGFERYGVPRHYFLDADGKVLDEDAGYLDAGAFLTLLNEVQLYQ